MQNRIGVLPTRAAGATPYEQLACVLCLGRMGMLAASADRARAAAIAQIVINMLISVSDCLSTVQRDADVGADVLHCMLTTLAKVTPVLVQNGSEWVLGRVLAILTRSYMDPTTALGSLFLFGTSKGGASTAFHGSFVPLNVVSCSDTM